MPGQRHAAPDTNERQRERSRRFQRYVSQSPEEAEASTQNRSKPSKDPKEYCPKHPQLTHLPSHNHARVPTGRLLPSAVDKKVARSEQIRNARVLGAEATTAKEDQAPRPPYPHHDIPNRSPPTWAEWLVRSKHKDDHEVTVRRGD